VKCPNPACLQKPEIRVEKDRLDQPHACPSCWSEFVPAEHAEVKIERR
jgi:hypothetical protein